MDVDDFVGLLRDELSLEVSRADLGRRLDELPGWDSVHLLWLLTILEQRIGRPISLPELLEAQSLQELHERAAA
ncbi:acyl carrier protein [Dactylosporangium sp. NPDC051485]|uniref:acyl carrier protein n=1 Tax=Dactylosporangium TaxID=35753 RepID=UPI0031E47A66